MTTANKITIARILLIPFFIVQILYYIETGEDLYRICGLLSFAVAAVLDGVDGYIARHYNQKSELGAMLDPLGDKLLLVSGIILLSLPNHDRFKMIPLWVTASLISRDVLLVMGWAVIRVTCGKVTVRPRVLGKIATVLQMTMVLWTMLKWDPTWLKYWTYGAVICTIGSGLIYVWDGMRQLSASPTSSANPEQ